MRCKERISEFGRGCIGMIFEKFHQQIFAFKIAQIGYLFNGIIRRGKIAFDKGNSFQRNVFFQRHMIVFDKQF